MGQALPGEHAAWAAPSLASPQQKRLLVIAQFGCQGIFHPPPQAPKLNMIGVFICVCFFSVARLGGDLVVACFSCLLASNVGCFRWATDDVREGRCRQSVVLSRTLGYYLITKQCCSVVSLLLFRRQQAAIFGLLSVRRNGT